MLLVKIYGVNMTIEKKLKNKRNLLFIILINSILPAAYAEEFNIESFADQLLCEIENSCKKTEEKIELQPIKIGGIKLPMDAARDRIDEQKFLVPKGAYLNSDGEIKRFTSKKEERVSLNRGSLATNEETPYIHEINTKPIIINIPKKLDDEK